MQRLGMPIMRANPFSLRPIEASDAESLVGRRNILREWSEHIRSGSPRLIALIGERGSGRTSLLQAAASWTNASHHAHIWPESDRAATVLTEMYVTFADFDAPRSTQLLGDRLVQTLAAKEGPLPLLGFDHPSAPGADHGALFLTLLPILHRLRALTIVTVTPAQFSAWPAEAKMAFDATPPLPPFTPAELRRLIENGFRLVSTNGWQPERSFLDHLIRLTGGQPGPLIRLLRDLVDAARGVRDSPVEMLLDLERPHDPVSAAFETAGATTLPTLPRSHPAAMISPEALAAGMEDIDRMADDLVEDPWAPVDVPASSLQRRRPPVMGGNGPESSSISHGSTSIGRESFRPESRTQIGDFGHRAEAFAGHPTPSGDSFVAPDRDGSTIATDGSIVIDRGEGTWGADAFPDDDSTPIYLEDENRIDPDGAFSPFAEWPEEESVGGAMDSAAEPSDGEVDSEDLPPADSEPASGTSQESPNQHGATRDSILNQQTMRAGAFSGLTDRSRRYKSAPTAVEPAGSNVQRRTRTRIRPQGPIEAKPSEDMGADVDAKPVHVFDGGALWVDPRIDDRYGLDDQVETEDSVARTPFQMPTSPAYDESMESMTRDDVGKGASGSHSTKVYRSQDGTTFLEIEDGCEPPNGFESDSQESESLSPNSGQYDSPVFAGDQDNEDSSFGIEENLDGDWDQDDSDAEHFASTPSTTQPPSSPTERQAAGFTAIRERLQGMRESRWEDDRTLDLLRLRALSATEIIVLEAASIREISPSDSRLQARLQVGRSRLSQIYNGLNRAGILSARKDGRTRYFRLSPQAIDHLEGES